ncbi:unnamed protein product [Prorocentrum cordatum]|uniref:Uncharacterized protein n=1 Tax=Prorocentrum cordatum TaxID=2364126 RepID=A0ABN9VH76_9DINO|nr:unnamed protein product [Polarella glacialis]
MACPGRGDEPRPHGPTEGPASERRRAEAGRDTSEDERILQAVKAAAQEGMRAGMKKLLDDVMSMAREELRAQQARRQAEVTSPRAAPAPALPPEGRSEEGAAPPPRRPRDGPGPKDHLPEESRDQSPTLPNWSRTTSEYSYTEGSDEDEGSMTDEGIQPAGPPRRAVELKEAPEARRDGAKRWSSGGAGSSTSSARPPQGRPSVEEPARHRHTQKPSKKKRDAHKAWANWAGGSQKEEKNEDRKRQKQHEWGDSKKKGEVIGRETAFDLEYAFEEFAYEECALQGCDRDHFGHAEVFHLEAGEFEETEEMREEPAPWAHEHGGEEAGRGPVRDLRSDLKDGDEEASRGPEGDLRSDLEAQPGPSEGTGKTRQTKRQRRRQWKPFAAPEGPPEGASSAAGAAAPCAAGVEPEAEAGPGALKNRFFQVVGNSMDSCTKEVEKALDELQRLTGQLDPESRDSVEAGVLQGAHLFMQLI